MKKSLVSATLLAMAVLLAAPLPATAQAEGQDPHYLHDWYVAPITGALFVVVVGLSLRRVIEARRRQKLDLVS